MTLVLTPREFSILKKYRDYYDMLTDAKLLDFDWMYRVQPYPGMDWNLMRKRLADATYEANLEAMWVECEQDLYWVA